MPLLIYCIQLPAGDMRDSSASYAYKGQVILFPPNPCASSQPGVRNSASFGVVAAKQNSHNWMYFKVDTPADVTREDIDLLRSEANTICRAAGFNEAVSNSAMTVERAKAIFNYSFNSLTFL